MRKYLIISLLFLSVGFCQKEYDINQIVERDGVYIKKFSDEIVNGKVFQMFGDNKVPLGMVTNGKINGKWTSWYKNGQKYREEHYKDGIPDGLWTKWYENGQKSGEKTYKDGERGYWTEWYQNGQKRFEVTYEDGKPVEVIGPWNEDGSVKE